MANPYDQFLEEKKVSPYGQFLEEKKVNPYDQFLPKPPPGPPPGPIDTRGIAPPEADMGTLGGGVRDLATTAREVPSFPAKIASELPRQIPEKYGRPAIEMTTATLGSIGGFASPIIGGSILGGGLGYGIGKGIADKAYIKPMPDKKWTEAMVDSVSDVSMGMVYELGGQAAGKLIGMVGKPAAVRLYNMIQKDVKTAIKPTLYKRTVLPPSGVLEPRVPVKPSPKLEVVDDAYIAKKTVEKAVEKRVKIPESVLQYPRLTDMLVMDDAAFLAFGKQGALKKYPGKPTTKVGTQKTRISKGLSERHSMEDIAHSYLEAEGALLEGASEQSIAKARQRFVNDFDLEIRTETGRSGGEAWEMLREETARVRGEALEPKHRKLRAEDKATEQVNAVQYYKNATEAVTKIIANRPRLYVFNEVTGEAINRLPRTLTEFHHTIDQMQAMSLFEYEALRKVTGDIPFEVSTDGIIRELHNLPADTFDIFSGGERYLREKIVDLGEHGNFMSIEEGIDAIGLLRRKRELAMSSPGFDLKVDEFIVDGIIENGIRDSIYNGVQGLEGKAYSNLKRNYILMQGLENDVYKASLKANKAVSPYIEALKDFAGGTSTVRTLISRLGRTPKALRAGKVAIKTAYKHMKTNPDMIVGKMFRKADDILKAQYLEPEYLGGIPDPFTGDARRAMADLTARERKARQLVKTGGRVGAYAADKSRTGDILPPVDFPF